MTFFCVPGDVELSFRDTFTPAGLKRLDLAFESYLQKRLTCDQKKRYDALRAGKCTYESDQNLLFELIPVLEDFIKDIFSLSNTKPSFDPERLLLWCRRVFLQRDVLHQPLEEQDTEENKKNTPEDEEDLWQTDLGFAQAARLATLNKDVNTLSRLRSYARLQLAKPRHLRRPLFKVQEKWSQKPLLVKDPPISTIRSDFKLYDFGIEGGEALLEAQLCLKCHVRAKDTCRTGIPQSNHENDLGNSREENSPEGNALEENANQNANEKDQEIFGKTLKPEQRIRSKEGCPLDQKISQMMVFKDRGFDLSALLVIMIDNPLVAATGHRICYDCAAACIFQKQDPINVPSAETQILRSVLEMPYGAEIYGLLLRWHPLRPGAVRLKERSKKRILVVGLGPAGFGLCYHLALEGHEVLGIDGAQILPLAETVRGALQQDLYAPLKDFKAFEEEVVELPSGFGGVAEYGITARWNKSYLRLIRLHLERFDNLEFKGSVRFGSDIDPKEAFENLGFDFVAFATGAGQQKILRKNHSFDQKLFAPGIKQASDFLMTLQLQGAKFEESLVPLDIDFPIHVVGGGLTAIDTATEAQAYFLFYLKKLLRYDELLRAQDPEAFKARLRLLSPEDQNRFARHIAWAKAYKEAEQQGQSAVFNFLKNLGGVTVLYRGKLEQAPSVLENPHEVQSALDQGIMILEGTEIEDIELDSAGRLEGLKIVAKDATVRTVSSRALFIAIGTQANRVIRDEYQMSLEGYKNQVGFYGDADPEFEGSVVKALASAKNGAKEICNSLLCHDRRACEGKERATSKPSISQIMTGLETRILEIKPINESYLELKVEAPLAAKKTHSGHLFKLHVPHTLTTRPVAKGLEAQVRGQNKPKRAIPLLVEEVDAKVGWLKFTLKTEGLATKYLRYLKVGADISLLGPTGAPFPLFREGAKIALITSYLRARSLVQYMQAGFLRGQGFHLVFLDQERVSPDLKDAFGNYASLQVIQDFDPRSVDHILIHANLDQAQETRQIFAAEVPMQEVISSVAAPMQCMMKALCAQCLQRVTDPKTGEVSFIFACKDPYQPLLSCDFDFSKKRLAQNELTQMLYQLEDQL